MRCRNSPTVRFRFRSTSPRREYTMTLIIILLYLMPPIKGVILPP